MLHQPQGLIERRSVLVGVPVVLLLPEAAELLLHQSLLIHHPLLVLVVSDLHLGGGVAATPIPPLPPMLTSVVRCHLPLLAILRSHLGLAVEAPLTRILGPGGRCEDGGPIHLHVKYR